MKHEIKPGVTAELSTRVLPQHTITLGNNPAAGVLLAAFCDFRLAAINAKFGLPEIKLGWPPSFVRPGKEPRQKLLATDEHR